MAKQNFIAGGYYGKLGETVGQRWKNIRTIRVYVIPHDPKTPAQMACRGVFSQGVPYAQQGMRINKGAPCWNYENKTEWQARMGTAVDRLRSGVTGDAVIPIFPDGYTPDTTLTGMSFTSLGGGLFAFRCSSTPVLAEEREAMVCIECTQGGSTETVDVFAMVMLQAEGDNIFTVDLGGYSPKDGGRIYGVTVDDVQHSSKMVYIAIQAMSRDIIVTVSDIAFMMWGTNVVQAVSELVGGLTQSHTIPMQIKAFNPFTQSYQNVNADIHNVAGQPNFDLTFTNNELTLWGESTIKGQAGSSFVDDNKTYLFPEIPFVATVARQKQSSVLGFHAEWSGYMETDDSEGETLVTLDLDCGYEVPEEILDGAEKYTPTTGTVRGLVDGSQQTLSIEFDAGEWENIGGATVCHLTGRTTDGMLDVGQYVSVSMMSSRVSYQNMEVVFNVDAVNIEVQQA